MSLKNTGIVLALSVFTTTTGFVSASHANPKEKIANFDFQHVSCNRGENEIRIVISGVKKSAGLIAADLYPNDDDNFLKGGGRIKQVRFAAKAPHTSFCINAPEPGNYAIAVYHDRNANFQFDKTQTLPFLLHQTSAQNCLSIQIVY